MAGFIIIYLNIIEDDVFFGNQLFISLLAK